MIVRFARYHMAPCGDAEYDCAAGRLPVGDVPPSHLIITDRCINFPFIAEVMGFITGLVSGQLVRPDVKGALRGWSARGHVAFVAIVVTSVLLMVHVLQPSCPPADKGCSSWGSLLFQGGTAWVFVPVTISSLTVWRLQSLLHTQNLLGLRFYLCELML